jgi:uncharacterized membrane protein SpoIIM required for sporulation
MTALVFEATYQDDWTEFERLTTDAQQPIDQQREIGLARLRRVAAIEFPGAVRAHASYVAVAAAAFMIPTIVIGVLVYRHPELILSVIDSTTAASFESMYSATAGPVGRARETSAGWTMFGYYIRHNVGVAFQCFAGGLFAGLGSLVFLVYNGAFSGALGGYLVERGLSPTFFAFVLTHSAFEVTAIVLSGAAGLRIGHALLAPGPLRRGQALVVAARDCAVLLYGVTGMLVVAAAFEAFWSPAGWPPHSVKYGVAALCWTSVIAYFTLQGRREEGSGTVSKIGHRDARNLAQFAALASSRRGVRFKITRRLL